MAVWLLMQLQSPFGTQDVKPKKAPPPVAYVSPEQVTIQAGKSAGVDLHFQVQPGLHVNSHTPRVEELIPTTLQVQDGDGVRLVKANFPPGKDFAFASNPGEKLSVYSGEFVVHVELNAERGEHLVQGTLHFQACSDNVCLPPRTIPVAVDVIAK